VNQCLASFYDRLLAVLRQPAVRDGQWQLLECAPAWDGNWTNDCFVVFAWQGPKGESLVAAVTMPRIKANATSLCRFANLGGKKWRLQDQLSTASYDWNGDDLQGRGPVSGYGTLAGVGIFADETWLVAKLICSTD